MEGTPMDMSHSVRGHILHGMHMPAGRVFTNRRLLGVKWMFAYSTREASTYIGDISTQLKPRNNGPLARRVERYTQQPTLLESPGLRTHDPRPDGANYLDPHCHYRGYRDREVAQPSHAQTTRPRVMVTDLVDRHSSCYAHSE